MERWYSHVYNGKHSYNKVPGQMPGRLGGCMDSELIRLIVIQGTSQ